MLASFRGPGEHQRRDRRTREDQRWAAPTRETLRTYPTYDRAQPGESFVRGVAIGLLACVAGLGVLYVAVMILAGMGMPRG